MRGIRFYLALSIIAIPAFVFAQSPGTQPGTAPAQGSTTPSTQKSGGTMASSSAIKVLSPKLNEKVQASVVTLRFQLVNTGLAPDPSPTYRVQLDSRDPVETTTTEYSFTGLQPGEHTITIDLVDANHTPVATSHTEVRFKSENPGGTPAAVGETSSLTAPPVVRKAALPLPPGDATEQLPSAGGELPLLSMVGFGVLAGGVISAMRTRK